MNDITIPADFESLPTQGSGFCVSTDVDIQEMSESELSSQIEGKMTSTHIIGRFGDNLFKIFNIRASRNRFEQR